MASTRCTFKYEPQTGDIDVEIEFAQAVDSGCYRCKAENIFGYDFTESNLIILHNPNIDDRPQTLNPDVYQIIETPLYNVLSPELKIDLKKKGKPAKFIINLPETIQVPLGEKFNSYCKVEGYPFPKVFSFLYYIIINL